MVVTRFAPSPTGYLHVGGARTALFNWLFARRMGGKFILRIEDTDLKRNTLTATQQVISDLLWLGIKWDQGPPDQTYFQSKRKEMGIYDKYVGQLLEQGRAYYCFETAEELDELRKKAESQKKGFVYQRPTVFPKEKDVQKARAAGKPVTIRFAMPEGTVVVNDLVRGEVSFDTVELGDFIIIKSDGFPTYNFACVVDDYLMKITHVIRGQEHLMNTPGQQELWKALGFGELPKYAHMSVTVSETGGKLSKRERPKALRNAVKNMPDIGLEKLAEVGNITIEEVRDFVAGKTIPDMTSIDAMAEYLGIQLPEINVVDFFKSGYLPEAMVNFLALLGWNPGDKREIMSLNELIECFDLSRLTKTNSLFDRNKLVAFNTEHIRMQGSEKVLAHFKDYLKAVKSPVAKADDKTLVRIIELCAGARTLADIERKSRFLFLDNDQIKYDEKAVKEVLLKNDGLAILKIVRDKLAVMEQFTVENIESALRGLADERSVGLGKVAQPLRVALCGGTISLPIFDAAQILGKGKTLERIDNTLKGTLECHY
jgi:glutamyl/glutaminyl-tRNA synthetase